MDTELRSYVGTNCPQVEMITNGKKPLAKKKKK